MRIDSMKITGFGALSGEIVFHPGLNLIVAPNESGKSTLAAAILALLYSVRTSTGKRWMSTPDEERYLPLDGSAYRISGILTLDDGQSLSVWRDLKTDEFSVQDSASGKDLTKKFMRKPSGDTLGETLTGLSRDAFERIAFLRQDTGPVADFADLSDRVGSLFTSGGSSVQQALERLNNARLQYDGTLNKGKVNLEKTELKNLRQRIAELEQEQHELEARQQQLEEDTTASRDVIAREHKLHAELDKQTLLGTRARLLELSEDEKRSRRLQDEIGKHLAECESLSKYDNLTLNCEEDLTRLHERLCHLQNELDTKRETMRQLQAKSEVTAAATARFGKLVEIPTNDREELRLWIDRAINEENSTVSLKQSLHTQRQTLERLGIDPQAQDRLAELSERLQATDLNLLLADDNESSDCAYARKQIDDANRTIETNNRFRELFRRSGIAFCCVGLIIGLIFFAAYLTTDAPAWIFVTLIFGSLITAGVGLGLLVASRLWNENSRKLAIDARVQAECILADDEKKRERQDEQCRQLAERCASDVDTLKKDAAWLRQHQGQLLQLSQLLQRQTEIETHYATLCAKIAERIQTEPSALPALATLARNLEDVRSAQAERDAVVQPLESVKKEITDKENTAAEIIYQLATILQEGGLSPEESDLTIPSQLRELLGQYKTHAGKKRLIEQLKRQTIPQLQEQLQALSSPDKRNPETAQLKANEQTYLHNHPEWIDLQPDQSAAEYRRIVQSLQRERESIANDSRIAETTLAVDSKSLRERLPLVRAELDQLHQAYAKAERFEQATAYAIGKIQQLASRQHSEWSPVFGKQLNETVEGFTRHWKLELTDRLQLRAVDISLGVPVSQEQIQRHFSRGALDQVYLCLRLLLANTLMPSRPIVFDDPFIHADDIRFQHGMNTLKTAAEKRQIFVFSCHESRHENLEKNHHSWKDARVLLPENQNIKTQPAQIKAQA